MEDALCRSGGERARRSSRTSTQNRALEAILSWYKNVLEREPEVDKVLRAKRRQRLPIVLTRTEFEALLARLDGVRWIMTMILHGLGSARWNVCVLCVEDIGSFILRLQSDAEL